MDTSGRVIAEQVVVISIAVLAFVVPSIIYVVTIYWGGISKRLLLSTSSSTTASPTHPPPASSAPRRRPDHVKITNHKSKLSHPAPLPPYPPSINHRPSLRDLKKSQQKRLGGEKSIGGGGSSGGASRYNLSNHTPLPPRSSNTTTTLPSPNTNNTIITAKLQNLSSAQESVSFWSRIFTKSSWLWFTGPPVLPPDPQIVNPTTGDASNNNFSTNEFSALASADTSSIHLPQTNVIHVKSATSDKDHHHPPPPSLPSAPVKQLQMRPMTDSSGIMSMAGNLVSVGPGIYHHQQQHPHLPPPLSQPPPNSILLSNNAHHTHHGSVALSTSTGVIQEPHFVINNTHQYHHQTHQQHLHFVTPPQYPYPPHLIPSYSSRIHSRFQSYSEISFPNTSSHNLPLSRLPYSYSVASTTTSSITRLFHEAAPALLSFSDIIYSVKTSHNGPSKKFKTSSSSTTTILKSVNGFMKAGSLTAIMGPSGCGKTTLLDILAGRKYSGEISGSIMINGKPRNNATFKRISAYGKKKH